LDSEIDSRLNGSRYFLNSICPNWGLKWRLQGHFLWEISEGIWSAP
jgi:hypothetical protein